MFNQRLSSGVHQRRLGSQFVYLDVSRRLELFGFVDFGRQESAKHQLPLLEPLGEPLAPDGPHSLPETFPAVNLEERGTYVSQ